MLRKMAAVSCFFIGALPCYAASPYAGLDVGVQQANFSQVAYFRHVPDANVKDSTHLAGRGMLASLFAGYGGSYQQYYLAAEANASVNSTEFHSSNDEYIHKNFGKTRYKIVNTFSLSVLPGLHLSEKSMVYVRLGYANSKFKISTTDVSLENVDKRISGVWYGLGIQQAFTNRLSLRLEYNQVTYTDQAFFVNLGATTKKTTISPVTSQGQLGVVYDFC